MNKIKYFLLSLLLFSNICYAQTNYFEAASNEYFYGDLNKAIELFTKSIENKQEIANSYMYRGAANGFLGKFSDALNDMDSSFFLDSSNKKINYYYGKIYLLKKEYKTAIQYTSKAISNNSKDASAYDQRAVANIALNNFAATIADENIAIKIDPLNQMYYTDRGFAKLKLKQYDEAIKDFNASLKLEPNQKAYADRGLAYSLLNQHQKAIADYTKSLEINPDDSEILYYRGISYQAIKKKVEACDDLKKSKELGCAKAAEVLNKMRCD